MFNFDMSGGEVLIFKNIYNGRRSDEIFIRYPESNLALDPNFAQLACFRKMIDNKTTDF